MINDLLKNKAATEIKEEQIFQRRHCIIKQKT